MTLVRSRGPPNSKLFAEATYRRVRGQTCQGVVYCYTADYLAATEMLVAPLTS